MQLVQMLTAGDGYKDHALKQEWIHNLRQAIKVGNSSGLLQAINLGELSGLVQVRQKKKTCLCMVGR
jgi:hypothetical protein